MSVSLVLRTEESAPKPFMVKDSETMEIVGYADTLEMAAGMADRRDGALRESPVREIKMTPTVADLVQAVREAAEEDPGRYYESLNGACFYMPNEANPKGCIVGHAMRALGITEDLDEIAGDDSGLEKAIYSFPIVFDEVEHCEAARWLFHAQSYQDSGLSWASAVAGADEKAHAE